MADSFNQTIREISTNGIVSTVSGAAGISGTNDGVNGAGRFFNPYGLAVAADGSLVVADTYNELVRVVSCRSSCRCKFPVRHARRPFHGTRSSAKIIRCSSKTI